LEKLLADPLAQEPAAKEALAELSTLFNLLGHMQGLHHIEFNMSLARGLDYYTGVIYEAVMLKSWNGGQPQVGSVAAGGRWALTITHSLLTWSADNTMFTAHCLNVVLQHACCYWLLFVMQGRSCESQT